MKRVHPSGASKRKEKKRKSLEIKKGSKSLNLWLAGSSCDSWNNDKSQTGNGDQIKPPSIQGEATTATSSSRSENKKEETTRFDRDSSISSDPDSEIGDEESHQETLDASKQNIGCFICPNESDHIEIKKAFMEKHPIQVYEGKGSKLSFDPFKLCYRLLPNGDKIHRKWLSYSIELNKVYCSCCMAFGGKDNRDSTFITGHDHELAAKAALQCLKGRDIESLLAGNQSKQREREVHTRRLVVQRLIDIVLFLGRQGIAYRGDKAEGAYSLDSVGNHGNFLELVMLVANYDVILQNDVKQCIEDSKKHKQKNKLIKTIATTGRNIILKDLHDSITYSVMVDSTQDVAVMDQLAICVRYVVQGKVYERLLEMTVVDDSSEQALYERITLELAKYGILASNIVACSFDGANNMKGFYNGLQAHFKKANENMIYTHCKAHVLNLVVADSTVKVQQAENLFGLVEEPAVFLSSSYKRMAVWEKETKKQHTAHEKLYRLQKIGATRWWSKHKALSSIIDESVLRSEETSTDKLTNVITVLKEISDGNFDCKSRYMARNLASQLVKFENLFISFVLLDMFLVITPVSKYLQTKTLDYAVAWDLVQILLKQFDEKRNDQHFEVLYTKTKEYATAVNSKLKDNNIDLELELDFTERRISKKKRMPSKDDATEISTAQHFKHVFFNILDCARTSIEERFCPNREILEDMSWLHPRKFNDIMKLKDSPTGVLSYISKLCKVERTLLLIELKQFADQYKSFIKVVNTQDEHEQIPDEELNKAGAILKDVELDSEPESEEVNFRGFCNDSDSKKCLKCLSCAFSVLFELSGSGLFTNLYVVYKFILTIPCTQLRIIKNRLRASLGQDLMSSLILMNIERDLFSDINKEEIINVVARSNKKQQQQQRRLTGYRDDDDAMLCRATSGVARTGARIGVPAGGRAVSQKGLTSLVSLASLA
nr:unnamed protein product [Callosobruchus analis]